MGSLKTMDLYLKSIKISKMKMKIQILTQFNVSFILKKEYGTVEIGDFKCLLNEVVFTKN